MSISAGMNEQLIPQDRTRGLTEGGTRDMIGLLIAVGLVFLVVGGAAYLSSLVGSAELGKDAGQFFVGP